MSNQLDDELDEANQPGLLQLLLNHVWLSTLGNNTQAYHLTEGQVSPDPRKDQASITRGVLYLDATVDPARPAQFRFDCIAEWQGKSYALMYLCIGPGQWTRHQFVSTLDLPDDVPVANLKQVTQVLEPAIHQFLTRQ